MSATNMSNKQIEATLTSNRGKVYRQIAAVFDSLPERFTATALYNAAKLESTHTMQRRVLIASVLSETFKCVSVRSDDGRGRHWKKPAVSSTVTACGEDGSGRGGNTATKPASVKQEDLSTSC